MNGRRDGRLAIWELAAAEPEANEEDTLPARRNWAAAFQGSGKIHGWTPGWILQDILVFLAPKVQVHEKTQQFKRRQVY